MRDWAEGEESEGGRREGKMKEGRNGVETEKSGWRERLINGKRGSRANVRTEKTKRRGIERGKEERRGKPEKPK